MFWKIKSQENWGEFERCVPRGQDLASNAWGMGYVRGGGVVEASIWVVQNYGHGEMRNRKLINRRNDITQRWQFSCPWYRLGKGRGKKGKSQLLLLVTHPSTNFAQQGLTLFSRRIVVWLLYAECIFSNFSDEKRYQIEKKISDTAWLGK